MRRFHPTQIIGDSPAIAHVLSIVQRVAAMRSTVLLLGESGTGKGLIAQAIHHYSPRRDKPFVSLNCGAMPEHLLESELFGHVRGAFTGANADKKGLLEVADGGTVFLDEIGEMPPVLQVKLLSVLQERRFRRVGGVTDQSTDMRIIAATNQNLRQAVVEGRFREDLYYRLNVVPIDMPALRERREDIPVLARHFLRSFADQMRRHITGISPAAMTVLEKHDWPGNIRELENVIERAVALETQDFIGVDSLPVLFSADRVRAERVATTETIGHGFCLDAYVRAIERRYVTEALAASGGVQVRAAELLGISFRSFRYLAKKYAVRERRMA